MSVRDVPAFRVVPNAQFETRRSRSSLALDRFEAVVCGFGFFWAAVQSADFWKDFRNVSTFSLREGRRADGKDRCTDV